MAFYFKIGISSDEPEHYVFLKYLLPICDSKGTLAINGHKSLNSL